MQAVLLLLALAQAPENVDLRPVVRTSTAVALVERSTTNVPARVLAVSGSVVLAAGGATSTVL